MLDRRLLQLPAGSSLQHHSDISQNQYLRNPEVTILYVLVLSRFFRNSLLATTERRSPSTAAPGKSVYDADRDRLLPIERCSVESRPCVQRAGQSRKNQHHVGSTHNSGVAAVPSMRDLCLASDSSIGIDTNRSEVNLYSTNWHKAITNRGMN